MDEEMDRYDGLQLCKLSKHHDDHGVHAGQGSSNQRKATLGY